MLVMCREAMGSKVLEASWRRRVCLSCAERLWAARLRKAREAGNPGPLSVSGTLGRQKDFPILTVLTMKG